MLGYFVFILLLLGGFFIKKDQPRLLFLFFVITVFSSIRYGIGYDYYSYLAESSGLKDNSQYELIPRSLENWSSQILPLLFFVVTSVFISSFYYLGIKKAGHDYLMETFFYVCFPFLFMNQLGIIRQGMATSLVFCAIALKDSKLYIRVLLVVIAYFCHQSAIVGVLIFLPFDKIKKTSLWTLFVLGFISATVVVPILQNVIGLGFLGEMGTHKASNYLNEDSVGEGKLMKYLIYFIGLIVLANYSKLVKFNKENKYYIGLIVFGVAIYALFSFNISLGKRLGMFFFSPAIFVVPQLFKVLRIPKAVYLAICILLFSLTIYVGSGNHRDEDPPGCSVTYPYRTIFDVL